METRIFRVTHDDGGWLNAELRTDINDGLVIIEARESFGDSVVSCEELPAEHPAVTRFMKEARAKDGLTHTQGPLEAVGNLVRSSMVSGGFLVAECRDAYGQPHTDEAKANAVLFAAAPELLATAIAQHRAIDQMLAWMIENHPDFYPTKSAFWPLIQEAKAQQVITKARGAA